MVSFDYNGDEVIASLSGVSFASEQLLIEQKKSVIVLLPTFFLDALNEVQFISSNNSEKSPINTYIFKISNPLFDAIKMMGLKM